MTKFPTTEENEDIQLRQEDRDTEKEVLNTENEQMIKDFNNDVSRIPFYNNNNDMTQNEFYEKSCLSFDFES